MRRRTRADLALGADSRDADPRACADPGVGVALAPTSDMARRKKHPHRDLGITQLGFACFKFEGDYPVRVAHSRNTMGVFAARRPASF
jgi:hypothetical protein